MTDEAMRQKLVTWLSLPPTTTSTPWLTTTPVLTSPSLRLTMELAPYLAPTLSTSPTAGSSTSTTKLTTSLEMLPPSPMTELPHTLTLLVLPTLSSDMPSPPPPLDMPLPTR